MRKMKDSGIEWIGEIPEDWEVKYPNNLFKERKFKNKDNKENNVLSLSYGKIIRRNISNNMGLIPANFETYNIVEPGNIVLRLTDMQNDHHSLRTGLVNERGIITSAYLTLEHKQKINPVYFHYLLHSYDLMKIFYNMGNGVRQNINYTEFSTLPLLSPDIKEQTRIANFLDEKCALIDRLVERHQEVIEKLKAYRQSVISEAVTRGLDPDAPMKDSGIPWIGKIPENWKIDKIKYISKFNPGCSRHFDRHESVGYLPMECLKHGYMTPLKTEYEKITSALTCFEDGDIVLAKVTPCFENGNIAIAHNLENHTGFGSSELFVFRCSGYETRFLFYIFQNSNFMNECISTMTGTGGLKRVSSDFIRNCRIPVPDLQSQQQIADYLDEKCAKIDRIIQEKEQIIVKLTEYKKSIIYEYVTGKKEVPAS